MEYLEETQDGLSDGKITLEDAIAQMNEKKAGAEWEIYSALVQILVGETSLDSAQQQLDDAVWKRKKRSGRYADHGHGFLPFNRTEFFHACRLHNGKRR